MSDQNQTVAVPLQQYQQLLQNSQPGGAAWSVPAGGQGATIASITIPCKFQTPLGSVKIPLTFEGPQVQSPAGVAALLEALHRAGWPLDAYQPRDDYGGGGGGGGGYGNRGAYGRGGRRGGY